MNKLSYLAFDPDNDDIAFTSNNGYVSPANEVAVRRQLSYPLKEIKDFVNNTVSVDGSDNAIQLIVDNGKLEYRADPTDEPIEITVGNVPSGGTTGNLLRKNSGTDYDAQWSNALPILTTAPVADNTNGVILVYLESEPVTKYAGYIYLIKD